MKLKSAVVLALCFAAVVRVVAAGVASLPERVPHGCYPVRLTVQTNADELILRLTGTAPDVSYMVMVRSNAPYARWLPFTYLIGVTNKEPALIRISLKSGEPEGVMQQTPHIPARLLSRMQFTAGSGEDADGDSLPDLYEDLVTRNDPLSGGTGDIGIEDGYQDPDGDGWVNHQEFGNGTDPFSWNQPPGPSAVNVSMKLTPGSQTMGTATLTWYQTGVVPELYIIMRKPASAPDGAWEMAARIKPVLNSRQAYEYVDTNVNTFRPPVYKIAGNHRMPPRTCVVPNRCDAEGIRQTMRDVVCAPATNNYALMVARTVPHARYLMLVREGKNGFWKASGFFVGSTNGQPVKLLADSRGLLTASSGLYLLPIVEHVPNVEHPEFICGSGGDADGDGLPDIYEVLATKTAPGNQDTGATGLLDGYKDLAGDSWTALEKYRRRCDPFAPDHPHAPIELTEPTQRELMKAFRQAMQHDFQYDVKLEARKLNPRGEYQALQENSAPLFPPMQRDARATNLQIRITVEMPEKKAPSHHVGGP